MFFLVICSTIVGVVCSDGIILGTEKIVINKMMVSGTDKRAYSISREVGCVSNIMFAPNSFNIYYRLSMDLLPTVELLCTAVAKKPSNTRINLASRFQDRSLLKDLPTPSKWTQYTHIRDHTALPWSWLPTISWRDPLYGWSSHQAAYTSTTGALPVVAVSSQETKSRRATSATWRSNKHCLR